MIPEGVISSAATAGGLITNDSLPARDELLDKGFFLLARGDSERSGYAVPEVVACNEESKGKKKWENWLKYV